MISRPAAKAHAQTNRLFRDRSKAQHLRLLEAIAFSALAGAVIAAAGADAGELNIVAAENFYGDIAQQVGGPEIRVTSILSNPDQDPHEFEARPSTARALAGAAIVIDNGLGYDPWAAKLLSASPSGSREVITAAELTHKQPGDNPHIWYDPQTAVAVARSLAQKLGTLDPAENRGFQSRLAAFEQSLNPLARQIAELHRDFAGTTVAATEPVFGYMAKALGLKMHNQGFQLAMMNGAEPSPAQIAGFEQDLRTKAVKILIYNNQTSDALTRRMRALAEQSGVPVVGVSETEPPGTDYQEWMRKQLNAVGRALAR
jgi:zinc/manganese transport system substrate-binding protein